MKILFPNTLSIAFRLSLIAVLGFCFTFSACKKDQPSNMVGGTGTITVSIDNTPYSFSLSNCIYLDGTLSMGNVVEDNALLQLHHDTPGTYPLNLGIGAQGLIEQLNFTLPDGTQIFVMEGSVTIDVLNGNHAEGSFFGKATDDVFSSQADVIVTDGKFSADY